MNKRAIFARTAVGAVGCLLLAGVAGAASADEIDDDQVEIGVEIAPVQPVGALTLTVDASETTLEESESADAAIRQFDGDLPTVTVTDDRGSIESGAYWYVTGQSTAFTADGLPALGAQHLGWTPNLITDDDGEVAAGDEVGTVFDPAPNNVGLVGEELLALALDSSDARATGTWQADAALVLKTPAEVAPGSYSATLTLTLWEDIFPG